MPDNTGAASCPGRILVMGVGNVLRGDDGVGVHAIRELQRMKLPEGVDLLDAGTAFIDALPYIGHVHRLIIIDAIMNGKAPGTVYRIQPGHASRAGCCTSIHGISIMDIMKIAQCREPETICVFGVEPEQIGWSLELSNTIKGSMPVLMETVRGEIASYSGTRDPRDTAAPRVC